MKSNILQVSELKKLLSKHNDADFVVLSITSFDEEGAEAELRIDRPYSNSGTVIMETKAELFGF